MFKYYCHQCNYGTNQKSHYTGHMTSKKHLNVINSDTISELSTPTIEKEETSVKSNSTKSSEIQIMETKIIELEEANARVEVIELYTVFNLPHVNQVYMMFRSDLLDQQFSPGTESLDAKLFSEDEIPWEELAFTTIRQTLKFYFQDRTSGNFRLHTGDIIKDGDRYSFREGPPSYTVSLPP